MADTSAHGRLTIPTPPAWPHFETFHVNIKPGYPSKYPLSQGPALAFGQIVFRQPWVGVYLSTALLCGAILLVCSFAAGLLIFAASRPYEGLAFPIPLFGYFVYRLIKDRPRTHFLEDSLPALALIGTIGILAMGYYNHATTGDAFLMPYGVSERHTCRAVKLARATYLYQSVKAPQTELRMRMRDLAQRASDTATARS